MNAREEREYYEREYETDQRRKRYDPHGEIITDAEREIWKQEQKKIDYALLNPVICETEKRDEHGQERK